MIRRLIKIRETIASVSAEEDRFIDAAEEDLRARRAEIETYIAARPEFRTSLRPLRVEAGAPPIVRAMAEAAAATGVGPMAAVAGALAGSAVRAMREAGARQAVVDNGGDIALALSEPLTVGVFTGPSRVPGFGLRLVPRPGVFSVCTSSGTVGHSLSFGRADAAVVIAADPALADAAATALGNAAAGPDPAALEPVMERLFAAGAEGALVVIDDVLLMGGEVPEIVPAEVPAAKVSGAPAAPPTPAPTVETTRPFWWIF